MLKSMTGFGQCQVEDNFGTQVWEIKSVNSKYLDVKWRLPNKVRNLEITFDKILRQHALRGRVEISLTLQKNIAEADSFNPELASAMLNTIEQFAENRGDNFQVDYNVLFKMPQVWQTEENELDEYFVENLQQTFVTAINDWNDSKINEANNLAKDINSRILKLEEWINFLEDRAPSIKDARVELVKERINEQLKNMSLDLDETRFFQEIVILMDKLDVSEELTRLKSHLERMRDLLNQGVDAGRRLEFTLQECFREINTLGNKVQDSQISRIVVDFKNELEKCKEQALNLE